MTVLIDISAPIRSGMVRYEGDPEIPLDFGVHTGTHVDALDGAPARAILLRD